MNYDYDERYSLSCPANPNRRRIKAKEKICREVTENRLQKRTDTNRESDREYTKDKENGA